MVSTLRINNNDSICVMYQGRLVLECVGTVCKRYLPGPWEDDISVMKKEYVKVRRATKKLLYQLRLAAFGLKGEPYEQ